MKLFQTLFLFFVLFLPLSSAELMQSQDLQNEEVDVNAVDNERIATTFETNISYTLDTIELYFKIRSGTPTGHFYLCIYEVDGSNIPAGTCLAESNHQDITALPIHPSSPKPFNFTFNTTEKYNLEGGNKYAIAVERGTVAVSDANYFRTQRLTTSGITISRKDTWESLYGSQDFRRRLFGEQVIDVSIVSPESNNYNNNTLDFRFNLSGLSTKLYNCTFFENSSILQNFNNTFANGSIFNYQRNYSGSQQNNYTYSLRCGDKYGLNLTVAVDNIIPILTINESTGYNTGEKEMLHLRFIGQDAFLYDFNLSTNNRSYIKYISDLPSSSYTYDMVINLSNKSYGFVSDSFNYFNVTLWDSHTKSNIKDIGKLDKIKKSIKYDTLEFKAYDTSSFLDVDYIFKGDRISPRYKLKKKGLQTLNFYIEGDNLKTVLDSKYKNHLIDYGSKTWFDSEIIGHEKSIQDLIKITNKKYVISVTDTFNEDWIEFNSMGKLNNLTTSFKFYYGTESSSSSSGGGGGGGAVTTVDTLVVKNILCTGIFERMFNDLTTGDLNGIDAEFKILTECLLSGDFETGIVTGLREPLGNVGDKLQELTDSLFQTSSTSFSFQ